NILNVAFSANDPEDARTVLKAVIASYERFLKDTYRNVNAEILDLISKARDFLQNDLEAKEAAYLKFRQNTPLLCKGREGNTVQEERLLKIDAKRSARGRRQGEIQASLSASESAVKKGRSQAELWDIVAGLPTSKEILNPAILTNQEPWNAGKDYRVTV